MDPCFQLSVRYTANARGNIIISAKIKNLNFDFEVDLETSRNISLGETNRISLRGKMENIELYTMV